MKGYELVKVRGEYIKNYNNAPYIRKPYSFYRQETVSTYNYRGVKVYIKETLNTKLQIHFVNQCVKGHLNRKLNTFGNRKIIVSLK